MLPFTLRKKKTTTSLPPHISLQAIPIRNLETYDFAFPPSAARRVMSQSLRGIPFSFEASNARLLLSKLTVANTFRLKPNRFKKEQKKMPLSSTT